MFCKSCEPICEPICEPEIVLKTFAADFQANPTDISCKNNFMFSFQFSFQFTNLTIHGNKHCCALEILKKSVSYSFSCFYIPQIYLYKYFWLEPSNWENSVVQYRLICQAHFSNYKITTNIKTCGQIAFWQEKNVHGKILMAEGELPKMQQKRISVRNY